jgi:pilus assembly protein CpaB
VSRATRFALAAVACAVLAGWLAFDYTSSAGKRAGPVRQVLVSPIAVKHGARISAGAPLSIRNVPARFAPPDVLSDPADAIGRRPAIDIPPGAFLTRSAMGGGGAAAGRFRLRAAERAVSVDVVVSPEQELLSAGNRVDLYASGFGGEQRTELLISRADVLEVADGGSAGHQRATLRLAAGQVAAVVRADVFARELRLKTLTRVADTG